MTENGIKATLAALREELNRLWREKATNERVDALKEDIDLLAKSIDNLRESVGSLMRAILVACVVWALGSAGFIIGVLTISGGGQ